MQKFILLQLIRLLIVLGALFTVYLIFMHTFKFIYPILITCILSLLIYPLVVFIETKLKFPRPLAITVVMLGLLLFFVGIVLLVITDVYQGTAYLAIKIPSYIQTFVSFFEAFFNTNILPLYEKIISFFHSLDNEQQTTIQDYISSITGFITSTGSDMLQNSLAKIPEILAVVPGSLTTLTFILLATFMMTNDLENIKRIASRILPGTVRRSTYDFFHHVKLAITGYLRAQLLLIFISACIILTGLMILRVEHALTIALIAAAVDLIPYLGTGIIFIPWIIYLYAVSDYSLTIGITVLYMVVIISRQILEPKILSSSIGVHPLIVLTTMFFGMQLWGIAGLFVAPIVTVLGNAIYQAGIFQALWNFIRG